MIVFVRFIPTTVGRLRLPASVHAEDCEHLLEPLADHVIDLRHISNEFSGEPALNLLEDI